MEFFRSPGFWALAETGLEKEMCSLKGKSRNFLFFNRSFLSCVGGFLDRGDDCVDRFDDDDDDDDDDDNYDDNLNF